MTSLRLPLKFSALGVLHTSFRLPHIFLRRSFSAIHLEQKKREYDIVVFGGTGLTGQYVAKEVARIAETERVTWAIAGRSVEKMKAILEYVEKSTGNSIKSTGIIKANVDDLDSLSEMAKKSKVVLNCVGPYKFYGEPVVKACVENGTNHIDISGEPQFLERMQLEYHSSAVKNKCYVVGACGFDSIPADMGTVFLEQQFDGQVNSVETYIKVKGFRGNYATWQSAIYGFASANELKDLRRKLFPKRLPVFKPKLKSRGVLHHNPIVNSWSLPFPGSDRSVVMRSQRYFYESEKKRPIQIMAYIQCNSVLAVMQVILSATVFGFLASFKSGRSLLEKFPKQFSFGLFDHGSPTKEAMDTSSFCVTLTGCGWNEKSAKSTDAYDSVPKKKLTVQVSGPDPGYITTPICMVQTALVLIKDAHKLPPDGGVYTPAATFAKTSLIDRLVKRGVNFSTGVKGSL